MRVTWSMAGPLLAALVAALLLGTPGVAHAHASLIVSDPAQGDVLTTMPDAVTFSFSEEITPPAFVVVTDPSGASVTQGDPIIDGNEVRQPIAPSGVAGGYTMAFRVVSADGHPITGQVAFSVGEGSAVTASPSAGASGEASGQASAQPTAESSARATADAVHDTVVAEESLGWWGRHAGHVVVAAVLFGVAGLLLLLSRLKRE